MSFVEDVDALVAADSTGLLAKHPTWERVRLGDVAEVVNGFAFNSKNFSKESGVPLLRIRDITRGDTSTFYAGPDVSDAYVQPGELVIGMDGDFNARIWPGRRALINQRVCKVVPNEVKYSVRFLAHVLPGYLVAVNQATPSVTVKHLSSRTILDLPVPLPPRAEQRRIADKIDELFSDIEQGEAALRRAKALLQRYLQAVLKAAVTGELTRDWRARHTGEIETGEELLARIVRARRTAWEEAELARMAAKGRRPKDDTWKRRYKEPVPPETSDLPYLPEGWAWATLPMLGEFGRGRSKHRPRNDPRLYGGEYPFIQTGEIRRSNGRIATYSATYNEAGLAQSKIWPAGTLCITIAANIAETGILEFAACFPDSVVGMIADRGVVTEYVEFFLRTARDEIDRYAPATAQKNINLEILGDVAVPFPPVEEQLKIVDAVSEEISKAEAADALIEESLRYSDGLRHSILKAAFAGKLVPQDPNDEPASVLLERIAAERAAMKTAERPRGGPRRKREGPEKVPVRPRAREPVLG